MSVSLTCAITGNVVETLTSNVPAVSSSANSLTHNGFSTGGTYNATSTPPATKCCFMSQALSGGSATMDMTSLTGTQGTVTLSTLKLVWVEFYNPATNANKITITKGASNGLGLDAAGATFLICLDPGASWGGFLNGAGVAIDGTHKTWDLTGTAAQALNVAIVAGI